VTLRFWRPSGLTLLIGAALILLPILAVLQYRWIGQVSDAERERRQRTLQHATNAITQELDVELVRAVIGLQVDGLTLRSDDWTVYTERVAGWHKATAAPGILRDVLLVDRGPAGLRLRHWSDDTTVSSTVPGRTTWRATARGFATELAAWESHKPDEPLRPADLLSTDGATIVVPIAPIPVQNEAGHVGRYEPVFGYTLIRLDMPYVKDEFLASLVDKHFRLEAGDEYRIAVVARQDRSKAIYQANVDDLAALVANMTPRSTSSRSIRISSSSSAWQPTPSATRCQPAPIAGAACSSACRAGRRRTPTASRCRSTTSRGGPWSRGTGPDRSRRPSKPRGCAT
jgi:hypothetical protein